MASINGTIDYCPRYNHFCHQSCIAPLTEYVAVSYERKSMFVTFDVFFFINFNATKSVKCMEIDGLSKFLFQQLILTDFCDSRILLSTAKLKNVKTLTPRFGLILYTLSSTIDCWLWEIIPGWNLTDQIRNLRTEEHSVNMEAYQIDLCKNCVTNTKTICCVLGHSGKFDSHKVNYLGDMRDDRNVSAMVKKLSP